MVSSTGEEVPSSHETAVLEEDTIPLVIVEGFLGGAFGALFWGNFEHHLNAKRTRLGCERRRSIFVTVGPVSSLHDRACELYYALAGGRADIGHHTCLAVDYGEKHSRRHRHARYGRAHTKGLYPQWSPDHPLHFLGHSIGGPTIIKLQDLIKKGHFGNGAHPNMILSVTSICAPFRGTQLVYTLGERPDAPPAVRGLSVGAALSKGVHVLAYLAPLLPRAFDVHAEARGLACTETSFTSLLRQLWKSDWAEERDATPFDVTFQASDEREAEGEGAIHPRTYYASYTASLVRSSYSREGSPSKLVWATSFLQECISPLRLLSHKMQSFDFQSLRPRPSFMNEFCSFDSACGNSLPDVIQKSRLNRVGHICDEYHTNDGIVPVFSQWHPLPCNETRCHHLESQSNDEGEPNSHAFVTQKAPLKPLPGLWHVHQVGSDTHHFSLVPFWISSSRQIKFWHSVGIWLDSIDDSFRFDRGLC